MKTIRRIVTYATALIALSSVPTSAQTFDRARVGEVRAFAVAPANTDAIARLHHDGWLEARGQLLPTRGFQALYKTVGRTWTADGVAEDRFAVPDVHDRSQRARSSDNPYGVLGPGDLVTSGAGRQRTRSSPLTYWIFTGRDVSRLDTSTTAR